MFLTSIDLVFKQRVDFSNFNKIMLVLKLYSDNYYYKYQPTHNVGCPEHIFKNILNTHFIILYQCSIGYFTMNCFFFCKDFSTNLNYLHPPPSPNSCIKEISLTLIRLFFFFSFLLDNSISHECFFYVGL